MITSFGDKVTEDIYNGIKSKKANKFPKNFLGVTWRKLDMINSAHSIQDLSVPPGNKLKLLKGKMAGFYSIRINDQYRIIFQMKGSSSKKVRIVDYH
jgi:proteic killer suppression protein